MSALGFGGRASAEAVLAAPQAVEDEWRLDDGATVDLAARRRQVRRARLQRTALRLTGVLLLLVAWEIAALILNDASFLPTVTSVVSTFFHYLDKPYPAASDPLWKDLLISARRILIGFVLAVFGGVLIGAAMWSWRPVREMIDPVIELTRPLPPLAFIPLLIVWFGVGETLTGDEPIEVSTLANPFYAQALARASNDYLIEQWLGRDPRFLGSLVVAPQDPDGAARQIRRLGGTPGVVQVLVSSGSQRPYGDPFYHRSGTPAPRSACRSRSTWAATPG